MHRPALDRLVEISKLWNLIEARAKAAEQFRHESITACINEMRYAGRRVVDVIVNLERGVPLEDDQIAEDLIVAKNYLYNADHDLTDATLFFAHKRFSRVIDFYGLKKLTTHLPAFDAFYPKLKEAQQIVQGSRQDRLKRKADYEKLATEYVPALRDMYEALARIDALRVPDSVPEKLGILDRNVTWVSRISFASAVAGFIGLGVGVWALFVGFHTDDRLMEHIGREPAHIEATPAVSETSPPR